MARAVIENKAIVIRVPLDTLTAIVTGSWASGAINIRMKITNVDEFAADLVRELNRETETGTTPVHRMFDAAIEASVEQGAFGIEPADPFHPDNCGFDGPTGAE